MDSILIPWQQGEGNIVISNIGGELRISSDIINENIERKQTLTFKTDVGDRTATLTVIQKGNRVILRDNSKLTLRDNSGNILTAKRA